MAKINVDLTAVKIRELLNHRRTAEAKAMAKEALASGKAGPDTQRLALALLAKGRGRPASGPYMWIEIGHADYWLDVDGVPEKKRTRQLMKDYRVGRKHVEACRTLYRKATEPDSK